MNDRLEELYESAYEAIGMEELIDASQCLKQMQEIDAKDPRTIEIAGDVAREMGEDEEAERWYRELDGFEDQPDVRGKAQMSLGFLERQRGNWESACDHLRTAIELFREADEELLMMGSLGALAEIQTERGQFRESSDSFQQLIEQASQSECEEASEFAIDAMRQRGDCLRFLGKLNEAQELYQQVIALSEDDEDLYDQLANALDGLGIVLQVQGKYDEAEQRHLEALRINLENDDDEGRSVNLGNLARLNIHRKNWDRAESYVRDSLTIDVEAENINGIGFGQLLLAEIEIGRGQYDQAEQTLNKARRLYERHGLTDDMASVISQLGYVYRLQGRLEEAEESQLEARRMAEEMEHPDAIASTVDELAEIRRDQGRLDEARELWQQALELFEQLNSGRMIAEVKQNLAKLDEA